MNRWYAKIHKGTGVMQATYLRNMESSSKAEIKKLFRGEPHFILREVKSINSDPAKRKKAVWMIGQNGYGEALYFTCPWCGAIGKTHTKAVSDHPNLLHPESLWCSEDRDEDRDEEKEKSRRCERHIFNMYLTPRRKKGIIFLDEFPK